MTNLSLQNSTCWKLTGAVHWFKWDSLFCSTEVKHTKVTLTFFQDQNLRCPKGEVPLYVVFISPCWPESILAYSQTHLPLIHVKPCFTGDVLNICTRARAKILVWQWKRRCKHTLKPKNKDKILLACVFMLCIKSMSYYTTLSLCNHWIYSVMEELIEHLQRK